MSKYDTLDELIVSTIRDGATTFGGIDTGATAAEAVRLEREEQPTKTPWRHIDARLQALRKKGRIEFSRRDGWKLKEQA
jgi:hypothetical protein